MLRIAPPRHAAGRGFSLLEVLVATSLVLVALTGLAPLVAFAIQANARARSSTFAVLLAQQKMEELVAALSEEEAHGAGPNVSPAGALDRNTPGYCDYLNRNGQPLGGGTTPPAGAAYLRRWSVDALPMYPDSARVLHVVATRSRGTADLAADVTRLPDTARLIAVRTRRSS
jgi:prepilin-type N-terminal cleavage/methylation domain-containing protein